MQQLQVGGSKGGSLSTLALARETTSQVRLGSDGTSFAGRAHLWHAAHRSAAPRRRGAQRLSPPCALHGGFALLAPPPQVLQLARYQLRQAAKRVEADALTPSLGCVHAALGPAHPLTRHMAELAELNLSPASRLKAESRKQQVRAEGGHSR